MAMSYVWVILLFVSVVFGALTGSAGAVGAAVTGAGDGVGAFVSPEAGVAVGTGVGVEPAVSYRK